MQMITKKIKYKLDTVIYMHKPTGNTTEKEIKRYGKFRSEKAKTEFYTQFCQPEEVFVYVKCTKEKADTYEMPLSDFLSVATLKTN